MKLDLQLEYWDQVGPTKTFAHPINISRLEQWLQRASFIVDYGCGYGRALSVLKGNGYEHLAGFDPAPAMIETARGRYPDIRFDVLKDFRSIPLRDASVDVVLLFAVLTSVPGSEGQRAIIDEITRVLRPEGVLYISDMWLQSDDRNVARYDRDSGKYGIYGVFDLAEGVTVRHHDRQWIESLLQRYERLALDEIEVQTMNGHAAAAFQWFGRKV